MGIHCSKYTQKSYDPNNNSSTTDLGRMTLVLCRVIDKGMGGQQIFLLLWDRLTDGHCDFNIPPKHLQGYVITVSPYKLLLIKKKQNPIPCCVSLVILFTVMVFQI